jgi:hypothetical protein
MMNATLADNIAAVEANREAERLRVRATATAIADAYKRLFATEDGKLVFADLRRRFVDVPIAKPGKEPSFAYFNEGRRSVVSFIYQIKESGEPDGTGSDASDGGNTDALLGLGIPAGYDR